MFQRGWNHQPLLQYTMNLSADVMTSDLRPTEAETRWRTCGSKLWTKNQCLASHLKSLGKKAGGIIRTLELIIQKPYSHDVWTFIELYRYIMIHLVHMALAHLDSAVDTTPLWFLKVPGCFVWNPVSRQELMTEPMWPLIFHSCFHIAKLTTEAYVAPLATFPDGSAMSPPQSMQEHSISLLWWYLYHIQDSCKFWHIQGHGAGDYGDGWKDLKGKFFLDTPLECLLPVYVVSIWSLRDPDYVRIHRIIIVCV